MSRPRIVCVVGARPNFMKMAPLVEQLRQTDEFDITLVHTGQHYDDRMSGLFFEQLGLPKPDVNLGVGGGSHAIQTARIMELFEPILLADNPDLVVVVGDVNSTIACALTAAKLCIPVAHIEAGLRSFDRAMPEEINRILTDSIADILYTTEPSANENLRKEGVDERRIQFVGNLMIDCLLSNRDASRASTVCEDLGLAPKEYAVLTLHRPSNVDDADRLKGLLEAAGHLAASCPVIFPCHPRTRQRIESLGPKDWIEIQGPARNGVVTLTEPLGYLDFLRLVSDARMVLTDSGGLQEETTILRVPCLTLRNETERPITVTSGSNRIVGTDRDEIIAEIDRALASPEATYGVPELWDGHAAERVVASLRVFLEQRRPPGAQ